MPDIQADLSSVKHRKGKYEANENKIFHYSCDFRMKGILKGNNLSPFLNYCQ